MRLLHNIAFLFKYSWNICRRIYVAAVIDTLLDSTEPFVYLIFPTLIINELTGERNWHTVLIDICIFAAAVVLLRVLKLVSRVFVNMSVNRCDVKNAMFYARHYLIMPYEKLEDEKVRDMQQTVSSQVRVNSFVNGILTGFATSTIKFIGFSYIISMLDPIVLIVILVIIAAKYFLNKRLSGNEYKYQPTYAKYTRRFSYLFNTMTNFDYAKEIRVNQASRLLTDIFRETLSKFGREHQKHLTRQMGIKIMLGVISFIQMILSYGYVAYSAIMKKITVGEFSLYIGAIYNLSDSFNAIVANCIDLKYLSKYVDDYHEYLNSAIPQNTEKEVNPVPVAVEDLPMLEFVNVSFTYPHTDREVLSNISIKIHKGEKLSIVGLNGAGKTTLIKLVCRLYEPTKGSIKCYGVDISTIDRLEYMKTLAVVFQDFKIFSFSFLDNIVLGQPMDMDKLNRSVENAGLKSKVVSLPHGIDTNIYKDFDEDGIEFSGGEGQKLVIARAYYRDADLVILDEPTAALDAMAENEIYRHFNEITSGKTSIFISHRLASTRFCDRIAVFESGKIVELGNHEELLQKHGLYAEMFEKQAEYYKTEVKAYEKE